MHYLLISANCQTRVSCRIDICKLSSFLKKEKLHSENKFYCKQDCLCYIFLNWQNKSLFATKQQG